MYKIHELIFLLPRIWHLITYGRETRIFWMLITCAEDYSYISNWIGDFNCNIDDFIWLFFSHFFFNVIFFLNKVLKYAREQKISLYVSFFWFFFDFWVSDLVVPMFFWYCETKGHGIRQIGYFLMVGNWEKN